MMLPTRLLRPSMLPEVSGPAVLLPVGSHSRPFLVCAEHAFFIGKDYQFEGFEKDSGGRWNGLAIEGVEIEVDTASAYDRDDENPPIGSVLYHGSDLIFVGVVGQSYKQRYYAALQTGIAAAPDNLRFGFNRWRVVVRDGEQVHEVWSVDATPSA